MVVRPPGAETGVLLARADGDRQAAAVGDQVAGRVDFVDAADSWSRSIMSSRTARN